MLGKPLYHRATSQPIRMNFFFFGGTHLNSGLCACYAGILPLPALFALVILEIGSCFLYRPPWTTFILSMLPVVAGMTGTCHQAHPLVEMGVS
jgi:hypothetical protein